MLASTKPNTQLIEVKCRKLIQCDYNNYVCVDRNYDQPLGGYMMEVLLALLACHIKHFVDWLQ